jgi:hypothetical protein
MGAALCSELDKALGVAVGPDVGDANGTELR